MTSWRDLVERPEWMADANCRGMDVQLFFPTRGENNVSNAARAVCRACDVAAECLAYAMNTGEHHGVWGGLSERQRRRVRAGQPVHIARRIEHGTEAGARSHYRAQEKPCEPCREAWNAATAERKANRAIARSTAP